MPTSEHWDNRHRTLPPFVAVGYGRLGVPFNRWMYRLRRGVFLRTLRPLVGRDRELSVLDVGSGTGFYLPLWRQLGATSVTAADLSPTAVERLGRAPEVTRAVQLDIGGELGQLDGERFDAVSAMDVLFHIVDDDRYHRAFHNLARLVRPGGLLIFSENFSRYGRVEVAASQVDHPEQEIHDLLAEGGFEPLARRRSFALMNEPQNTTNPLHRAWWKALRGALTKSPRIGAIAGPLLYPIESTLIRRPAPGPSTDLMVCRRTDRPDPPS